MVMTAKMHGSGAWWRGVHGGVRGAARQTHRLVIAVVAAPFLVVLLATLWVAEHVVRAFHVVKAFVGLQCATERRRGGGKRDMNVVT